MDPVGLRKRKPACLEALAEMTAILLLAALLGLGWNHRLLHQVWKGAVAAGGAVTDKERSPGPLLPLGLMQAKELYDRREALLVDARDEKAFAAGHIRGAVSLPVGEMEAGLQPFKRRTPLERPLVVYCNGYDCRDSFELGARLLREGYAKVHVFIGGYPEWEAAGYPTAQGTP